ncbi:MAG: molybdopterin-dependent oxidoreductase, partial [Balneolaceae bacterium]
VLRITPRYNPYVNDYWMPDEGRMHYTTFNENRVSRPSIRIENDREQIKTSWNNAFETFTEQIELFERNEILVIGSPHASVEENYILNKFSNLMGLANPTFTPHIVEGAGDGFLLTDDQAPNTLGAELIGIEKTTGNHLKKLVSSRKFRMVILLSDHLIDRNILSREDLHDKYSVIFATNESETTRNSDLVIPITTAVEHAASYINVDGRIQRTFPAKETQYTNRRLNLEMSEGRLDRYGTSFDNWVSEENKVDCLPLWDVMHLLAEKLGLDITYDGEAREIMNEISDKYPVFKNVSYQRMDDELGIQLDVEQKKVTQ